MPVSFSYSGERVLTKKSSKPLMNELSWTTVIAFGAAPTRRGASAAAPPARAAVRNSRRVLMGRPPLGAGGMRAGSLLAGQNRGDARDLRRTDRTDQLQALAASVPPRNVPVWCVRHSRPGRPSCQGIRGAFRVDRRPARGYGRRARPPRGGRRVARDRIPFPEEDQ